MSTVHAIGGAERYTPHTCDNCGECSVNVERMGTALGVELMLSGFWLCPKCMRDNGMVPRTQPAPRPTSGIRGLARLKRKREAVTILPTCTDGIVSTMIFRVVPMCGGRALKQAKSLDEAMEYCYGKGLVPYAPNGELL